MKKLVLCFLNLTFILSIYSNLLAQNQRFRFVIEESFAEFDGFYYLHLDVSTQETSEVWKTKKQGEGIKVILHQGSIGNMRALRIQKWRTYKRKVTKKKAVKKKPATKKKKPAKKKTIKKKKK